MHADRLLPSEPGVRATARELYDAVSDHPIISPHGHVDPRMLLDDQPFADPTSLLVQPDHYVTRLLHANGVSLTELGVGRGPLPEDEARDAWRLLCTHWPVFRGTPVRYWFDSELGGIFGVTERPSAVNADRIYDQIAEKLAEPAFRPRNLLRQFGIEVLATTDDPADDLSAHAAIAADPNFPTRVIPTFRPDRYLEAANPGWAADVDRLGAAADTDVDHYAGYIAALEERRRHFIAHGAVSTDHSHLDLGTTALDARRGGTDLPSESKRGRNRVRGHRVPAAHAAGDGQDVVRRRFGHDRASRGSAQSPRADGDRVRIGHRPRHPGRHRVHQVAAAPPGALRHPSESAPGAVHGRCRHVQQGDRPAGRLLSVGLRRCALVVPGQPDGDPPFPAVGVGNRGPVETVRIHRRHPGVLFHSRPATTCPGGSMPDSWPDWWPNTDWIWTRPGTA